MTTLKCFEGEWQEIAWAAADKSIRGITKLSKTAASYEPFYCKDCTPSYAYTMRLEGKCEHPEVKFKYDDEEGFIGYDPARDFASHTRANASRALNLVPKPRKEGAIVSKYRGVSWNKARQKWHVRIHHNKNHLTLGFFEDEDEAGRVYADAWQKIRDDLKLAAAA